MSFSSITFVFLFLPLFLTIYFLFRNVKYRNCVLLSASLIFYIWAEMDYTLVLLGSVIVNYYFGLLIARQSSSKTGQVSYPLVIGIACNLGILFGSKYLNFAVDNTNILFSYFGIHTGLHLSSTHLLLGVSFFTFHGISYLVDIYRKVVKAEKNVFFVSLYFFLFPHQVAGPIVRYKTFLEQKYNRRTNLNEIQYGIERFIIGLTKKVLLANQLSEISDLVFGLTKQDLSTGLAWIGIIAYTFQIYFDFSGYSDMAIGLAKILGFNFDENFNSPYRATSVTDFWRRWHITLSRWFLDYVYIPMGGNRKGPLRTYLNLLIVFILCGFWHGASWTFLLWGLWHGCFLVLEKIRPPRRPRKYVGNILTFFIVLLGWIPFRSNDLSQTVFFLNRMFSPCWETGLSSFYGITLWEPKNLDALLVAGIFATGDFKIPLPVQFRFPGKTLRFIGLLAGLVLVSSRLADGSFKPFVYFKF